MAPGASNLAPQIPWNLKTAVSSFRVVTSVFLTYFCLLLEMYPTVCAVGRLVEKQLNVKKSKTKGTRKWKGTFRKHLCMQQVKSTPAS